VTDSFEATRLLDCRVVPAPDGSQVRPLLALAGGSMAHFELPAGQTSAAVVHRSVEELWFILQGRGEMWRKQGDREQVVPLAPQLCISLPVGTHFQFRALGPESLCAIAVTLPPWPGAHEALSVVGPWEPSPGASGGAE